MVRVPSIRNSTLKNISRRSSTLSMSSNHGLKGPRAHGSHSQTHHIAIPGLTSLTTHLPAPFTTAAQLGSASARPPPSEKQGIPSNVTTTKNKPQHQTTKLNKKAKKRLAAAQSLEEQSQLQPNASGSVTISTTPRPANPNPQSAKSRPRAVPSKKSGGVPEPSPHYINLSLRPSVTLPTPHRILVIVDLNGTLLYRPNKSRPFHFVERPHARDFLAYCIENFQVAIWSSARPHNVERMVAQLLTPQQIKQCVLVWARDRFGLSAADYDARIQCYKRLTRVWEQTKRQGCVPREGWQWDQTNTVLVDDSPEKGRSEPFNILALPEFSGLGTEASEVLPQVHDYLNSLCYQSNISNYMRQTPFALDPGYLLPGQ